MLIKNPSKRISVRELFEHPWLSKYKEMKLKKAWGRSYSDSSSDIPEPL